MILDTHIPMPMLDDERFDLKRQNELLINIIKSKKKNIRA